MIGRMMALACALTLGAGAARAETVDDAGHLMQLEHPKEIAELIADFVRKGR